MRFERLPRTEFVGGHKVANREAFYPARSAQLLSTGDFLSRLWALFGPPEEGDEGFSYSLLDRDTGLRFRAYSGASGPAYGSRENDLEVIEAFERLVAATAPADCELSHETDFGRYRAGARNGVPFDTRDRKES